MPIKESSNTRLLLLCFPLSQRSPESVTKASLSQDSVLGQRVEREHSSNLVLPDSMKAKSEIGYIVGVGEKVKRFKKGQMVLFDKFASHGAEIELVDVDGVPRNYLLVKDFDLLLVLKKVTVQPDPSPASQSQPDSGPSPEGD